ncbi:beta-lactamase family protein [Lentzea tibetensis]|uniref:Beta-lactamase family protein n=1 Tax=Lentzea tibetensis TaxID=2591470 RepID=A0A563F347_9PSEU|nr:serine hydrolase domain-containing protein [Lentzea tibetensis]TWP54343.1 beta-lactamase family protein [Lentzea tibetensis]
MSLDTDLIPSELARLARDNHVPGAQLAIHHHGRTLTWEFGEVELGTGRTLQRDTAVPVGSVTKAFTATLAMSLVSDGDLDLDVPVTDQLPELAALPPDLTLRHLLSHTGGLTSDSSPDATTSLRRHALECCELPLVRAPGTSFSYSNVGYIVAARLVEAMTGMTWDEAVDAVVLQPLGITPAFVGPPGSARTSRPIAAGHAINRATGAVRPVEQSLALAEAATGALATSALDLVVFGRMHLVDDVHIVDAANLAMMRSPVPGADPFGLADGWGLGLATFQGGWLGHDGTADGTSCHLRIHPESETVVALTSNSSSGFGVWKQLVGMLHGIGFEVGDHHPVSDNLHPMPSPTGCLGRYVNGDTEYSVVSAANDDRLRLAVDGELSAQLTVYDGLMFSIGDLVTGQHVQFGRFLGNPSGRVDGIQITGRLASRTS